ncbi:FAD-dependent oxidoreductase [Coraliomargarita sp. SDUM461004]|uniref:FAD-dependent oxidoreductase n=1 Tax=Thalassobacterium sedimentorum TaxID=3041258 RepID=A0ABU1ALY1_9BACT|nr:FAD-dependent oxidoreductase [Coraliomargarita sp. SDUM461004]MDQ8194781.1 FAD-dependent oxidoreductase [Coraliomargarita sp. SDUM461004]
MNTKLVNEVHEVDVCVVGGGMSGLIAAIAAARRGSSVLLLHDRPVLGGNASSEVRMWIMGAHGRNKKEAGILEEIQLCNAHRNPSGSYSVWDSVLYEFATFTPGLTTLLNCSCNNLEMNNGRISSVDAWQLTTQTWHRVVAKLFIDCSGDSILAPLSGADTRCGRESREEFNESIAPLKSDLKTMGNSVLLQLEETTEAQDFTPPGWAYRFDEASNLPSRIGSSMGSNFWWIELGGLQNTIDDAELIRDELFKVAWGVWDYMKNAGPQAEKLKNWRLRWLGSLPGKRENRRYIGDHVLTQNDVQAGGLFEDIVAYGGWSMDDHHPAGLYYPGRATLYHKAPSPYGIPFRSLYSRNVANLLCAGRNISATHSALSSTRVMGTCSILGQAVGTAAALCVAQSITPRQITGSILDELQNQLMQDDCWLPGKIRDTSELMQAARIESSDATDLAALRDGHERNNDDAHAWVASIGSTLTLSWDEPRYVDCLRLVFDSDLSRRKEMPCKYPLKGRWMNMPQQLVRSFCVEIKTANGEWRMIKQVAENRRRLVVLPVCDDVIALRWTGHSTWGDAELRVFSIEAMESSMPLSFDPPKGLAWTEVISKLPSTDLAVPDNGCEEGTRGSSRVGA